MKSRTEIIKAQESIGNVEMEYEVWKNLINKNQFIIFTRFGQLYFAPREVVHPACQKKKDNGSDNHKEEDRCFFCGHLSRIECQCEEGTEGYENFNNQQEIEYSKRKLATETFGLRQGVGTYNADKEPDKKSALVKVDNSSGSDIPSSKIFEDVIKLIDEHFKIPMNYKMNKVEWEVLKSKIKEKWGKIER